VQYVGAFYKPAPKEIVVKNILIALFVLLSACTTTPYRPPVVVSGSQPFSGIAELLAAAPDKELDVILVHGMCTHGQQWAFDTINLMARAANQNAAPIASSERAKEQGIDIVNATTQVAGGIIHFSAFIWSDLTAPGKKMLAYDNTGTPNDCAVNEECKPQRAKLNGQLKDTLLNDCLSDALIYQGERKESINSAFIAAITNVVSTQMERNAGKTVPLVLVSESLGSKMTFDALNLMAQEKGGVKAKRAGDSVVKRISYLYMGANQLPLLTLADRAAQAALIGDDGRRGDALSEFLDRQPRSLVPQITVVAFTDPNDLLSYRLLPKQYGSKAAIANVLVSNDKTYFGYLENPYTAHTTYLENNDVTKAIVCGIPDKGYCK
jgi:hypothetical protein